MATQWDTYLEFCDIYHGSKVQATVESLSLFIQYVSNKVKSPGAVANHVSGVKTMHIINELDTSIFDDYLIKMMVRGVNVVKKHVPRKAATITPDILEKFFDLFDHTKADDVTYWALFILAFFLLARKSNLVPDTVLGFDRKKQLTREDVVVTPDSLLVTLKWSKTNQVGQREIFPLLRNDGSKLCPVRAYNRMVAACPAPNNSPTFLLKRYGKWGTVTYRQYQAKLKSCVLAIGLDAALYTSHSFRRGGATYAFQCGLPGSLIKKLGDWKSDAYLEYIDCPMEDRLRAGRRIRAKLNRDSRPGFDVQ